MKSDFTFAKDDAQRFLPWHIAIMVALAAFLLALVLSLGSWVGRHEADYAGSFAVIIPGTADALDTLTANTIALLKEQPGITTVKPLSEDALRDLLAPWIGNGEALQGTPLPVVLDVQLKQGAQPPDPTALAEKLHQLLPTIELDIHNSWAAVFASFVRILQALAILLTITILGAMSLMIVFSARASLHAHERTVDLLHAMGAEDQYIARQFQREHFRIGLRAAAIGTACAAAAYWGLGLSVADIQASVLPSFSLTPAHLALFCAMPLLSALLVRHTTRVSVLGQLSKTL